MQNPNYVQYPRFQDRRVRFEALNEAFAWFGRDWQLYVTACLPLLFVTIPYMGYSFYDAFRQGANAAPPDFGQVGVQYAVSLTFSFIQYLTLAAVAHIAVKRIDGKEAKPFEGFASIPFGSFLAASFMVGVLTIVGCCLCVLPSLMVSGLFFVTYPLITVSRMGPVAAMSASFDAIKPHMWTAVALYFVASLVMGLSVIFCGIGIVAGLPIMAIAIAITYRDLFPASPDPNAAVAPPVTY